ncbi:MAG: VUT family protein [Gaiellaceae bacterium]
MRLAILTGIYVGVVCSAQIGAQKIVELPWTGDAAPGGAVLIGISLALIEVAHRTAPTRREGWINAQVMIGAGFAASALLAGWIAVVDAWSPAFPGQGFGELADTWRIVAGSLAAFAVSETIDNAFGARLRDLVADPLRVLVTNAVSAPLDTLVFLLVAFGSLEFFWGQIEAKLAATVVLGIPLVLALRRALDRPLPVAAT